MVEVINPPIMVQPNGAQRVPPLKVKGNKPPIVVPVVRIIGEENIESIIMRDPTMEEAYLSIIK